MTPAEARFKAAVRACVQVGLYPGAVKIMFVLGRKRSSQTINDREMKWRAAVLRQMGWRERSWPHRRRYTWIPPRSWRPISRREVFYANDGYSRG